MAIQRFVRALGGGLARALLLALALGLGAGRLSAQAPLPAPAVPENFGLTDAVRWALTNNPNLAMLRQQHGIAEAGVVIARTYPFNPIWQSFIMGATGPPDAVTNHVFAEQVVRLDLELKGQGRHRRAAARAALSRADWEIAAQEAALAIRTVRAFNTVLYRQEKLRLIDATVRLLEESAAKVERLMKQNRLRPADLILARSDLAETRAQRVPAQAALAAAWQELRRTLGILNEPLSIQGDLGSPNIPDDEPALAQTALDSRADLQARQLAIQEAEARLRLEIANRCPNPSIGPAFEYNETRVSFIGLWSIWSIPTFNTRRGEVLQRRAELERSILDVRQTEVQVQQDVQAALARLRNAVAWVKDIRDDVLPSHQKALTDFEKLFDAGDPGVDMLRLIDIRRRLLRARDTNLDAQWELSQAQADLAAAVGDPMFGVSGAAVMPSACDNSKGAEEPCDPPPPDPAPGPAPQP